MKNIKVITYDHLDKELVVLWKELWRNAINSNYYNSYKWFLVCLGAYNIKKFKIYTCFENGKLVAVFPTVIKRKFGFRVISCPGDQYIDKAPLLLKFGDLEVIKSLINTARRDGNLFLAQLDSEIVAILKSFIPQGLASIISVIPYVNLKEELNKDMSKSDLRKIRKIINCNKENLSYKYYSGKNNLEKIFQVIVGIDQASTKKLKLKDQFSKEISIKLYKAMIEKSKNSIRIDILYNNNIPIVYIFAVVCGKSYLALNTAFLPDYKRLYPGKLLIYYILKNVKESGYRFFSFGMGHSSLKAEFTKSYVLQYDFYYSRKTIILFWWKLLNLVRRLRICLLKTKNSKDYLYLFKTLN